MIQINQNAYLKQLATYGSQVQKKLMSYRIFISGISGLGIEVAKNIILTGPKRVTLYDPQLVTFHDLGRNIYCDKNKIGKTSKAQVSLQQLKQLNLDVQVTISIQNSPQYIANNFQCAVILDNYDKKYLIQVNKAVRTKNVGFIVGGCLGLYGYTFVDFGDKHKIFDADGIQHEDIFISAISQQEKGVVNIHNNQKGHNLNDGDIVKFRRVKGMAQINQKQYKVQVKSPYTFTIGDTRKFSPYQDGGIASKIKIPFDLIFVDFQKSLNYPSKKQTQLNNSKYQQFFGVVLNGLYEFYQKNQKIPRPLNIQDAKQLKQIVKQYLIRNMKKQQEFIDEQLIQNISLYANTQISPCTSFWGGVIAQQIVKFTGKYIPITQWLHHHSFQCLPEKQVHRTIVQDRYHDLRLIFGDQFIKKASQLNSFIIGAGGLGCQFVKMFSLLGFSRQEGKIYVADYQNIKQSNLNQHFLFNKSHIGMNKGQKSCQIANIINQEVKFQNFNLQVSSKNQNVFNYDFWNKLDFVVSTINNAKSQKYIDEICVQFQKPFFYSQTLGMNCSSQIVIPHKTLSFSDVEHSDSRYLYYKSNHFPYKIQHTIQWARQFFQATFTQTSTNLHNLYTKKQQFFNQIEKQKTHAIIKLKNLKQMLGINLNYDYYFCVKLAVDIFQQKFNYQIRQLLIAFNNDYMSEQNKKPFWSGLKKLPSPITFNINEELHLRFVQATANIYASIFNIPSQHDPSKIAQIINNVDFIRFTHINKKTTYNDKKNKQTQSIQNEEQQKQFQILLNELKLYQFNNKNNIVQFQEDNNYHHQFIISASNLRAKIFEIDQAKDLKIKIITAQIRPSTVCTTSMIAGAVGIQIIKYILNKNIQQYKNANINLALSKFIFSKPLSAILNEDKQYDEIMLGPIKAIPAKFTKWQKIYVKGPMRVQQLKNYLQNKYCISIELICYKSYMIYSNYHKKSSEKLSVL